MEDALFTSSKQDLLRLMLSPPAILAGVGLLLVGATKPAELFSSFSLSLLALCIFLTAVFAVFYGGRYVQLEISGDMLLVERPYSLSGQRDSLDLTAVRQVAMYTSLTREQRLMELRFYGFRNKEELLQLPIVPLAAADAAAFSQLLKSRSIEANF